MHKGKSLSDSSTSESEDDGHRVVQQKAFSFPSTSFMSNAARKHSSESEDDFYRKASFVQPTAQQNVKLMKRSLSNDEDAEEPIAKRSATSTNGKGSFKMPFQVQERDVSSSESEDQISSEHCFSMSSKSREMGRKMKPNMVFISGTSSKKVREQQESEHSDEGSHDEGLSNTIGIKLGGKVMSEKALKMMAKMGYIEGTGLGKYSQGRTEIVEASKQRGRRGLGLQAKGLEASDVQWDFGREEESVKEDILWLQGSDRELPNFEGLQMWMKMGKKVTTIDNETEFCDPEVLDDVLTYKSVFDILAGVELRNARTRSNPFETIHGAIFLNRAAMKMANMDACFDYMFTKPKDKNGAPVLGPDDLLYFADVCAGPGGFSEYILYRKKWECKGFGFTLKEMNDFKLDEFFSGSPETFEPVYGKNGDGNIYKSENLKFLQDFVLDNTDNRGVHFMMADGGFSVEGNENIQEVLSKQLYLCQCLCALMILRVGGHFVCKLFDLFTQFSVGLIYLMYHAFDQICIFKPNTSRPANSERYIICKWRKENIEDICSYLYELNCTLNELKDEDDVVEIVPLGVMKSDEEFFEYITQSNNKIGKRQIVHLDKIRVFAQNTDLHDDRQADFRNECLAAWDIPIIARSTPSRPDASARFQELMRDGSLKSIVNSLTSPELLDVNGLSKLSNVCHFKCVVQGELKSNWNVTLFLSLGRSNIYYLEQKNDKWVKFECTLELPADTLFYGEFLYELRGEGRGQKKSMALHLIDILYLAGKDIRAHHFDERLKLARKLAKAISKPSKVQTAFKVKEIWELQQLPDMLERLSLKRSKGSSASQRLSFTMEDDRHFHPLGVLIFKTIAEPWVIAYSKSYQKEYYFNTRNKQSSYDRPGESAANFTSSFTSRIFWSWDDIQLSPEQSVTGKSESKVHGYVLCDYVAKKIRDLKGTI